MSLSSEISAKASFVIENPRGRQFEDYVATCNDNHWGHISYSLTLSSLDRIKACRVSLLQQALPRLTKLEIKGIVDSNNFNYVLSVSQYLKEVTIIDETGLDRSTIEWPKRPISISFIQPAKP